MGKGLLYPYKKEVCEMVRRGVTAPKVIKWYKEKTGEPITLRAAQRWIQYHCRGYQAAFRRIPKEQRVRTADISGDGEQLLARVAYLRGIAPEKIEEEMLSGKPYEQIIAENDFTKEEFYEWLVTSEHESWQTLICQEYLQELTTRTDIASVEAYAKSKYKQFVECVKKDGEGDIVPSLSEFADHLNSLLDQWDE